MYVCMATFLLPFLLALLIPFIGYTAGDIVINEIAWMGTKIEANDEWLELYNAGSGDVSLSGWKLETADGGIGADLQGVIPAGGFFLLERRNV